MEDDIDIEEHDVMDNPRIKSIFPDLSCVKIEIPDEEEVEEQYEDPPLEYQSPEMMYQYEYRFETTSGQMTEPNNEEYAEDDDDEEAYFFGNEIILGSKPTIDPEVLYEEALNSQPVVYLENWEEKLKNSPCFCNTCQILFSTVNALDAHKMVSHSYLVALDTSQKNTARKSTVTSKFCNHCSKTFPDDTSLIKHLYELLPLNNFPKVKDEVPDTTKYHCDECGKTFPTYSSERWHNKVAHQPKKPDSSIVKNTKKIKLKHEVKIEPIEVKIEEREPVKKVSVAVKTTKTYKARIPGSMQRDGKFFVTSLVPKNTIFQCHVCAIGFMSCFSALQHSKSCGKTLDYIKCGICKRKIRRKDEKIHETQHSFSDKLKIYTVHKNIYDKVLCKCPKCLACFDELCFWAHYKNCTNSNSAYCPDCDINIGSVRYNCHRQKHLDKKLTKKDFIIIEFHDQHTTDEKVLAKPKKIKAEPDFLKFKEKRVKIEIGKENSDDITLYYCEFCGCCQYILSHKGHINGECKNKIPKRFCDKCGLSFSAKSMERHIKLHEKRTFTLKDIKIICLRTGVAIDPPMSELFKCLKCKKHFLFRKQVHSHNCKTEKYIVCKICSKKYNLQAYKVHKLCHTFDKELIPELLKKYNSINNMWNVVFLCSDCDLVSMSYDSAVNHAQNHVNNIQVTLQDSCDVCDFIIGEKDMKKHKKLHLNNGNINRDSFRILKYCFEDLFKENWLDMFASLPNQHKLQILSKSIYRYTRNVKLNTIVKAPTDDIRYFCMICKDFVEGPAIGDHLNSNCDITNKYMCKICRVTFNSLKQFVAHEGNHEKVPKRRKFVTFNNVSDKEFNQKLMLAENKNKKVKKKSLKVIKSKSRDFSNEGVKKKYKIYKCAKCFACVSLEASMRRHTCITDENKKFCPICEQYFSRKKIALHMQAHKHKPNVNKDTLTVVYFNCAEKSKSPALVASKSPALVTSKSPALVTSKSPALVTRNSPALVITKSPSLVTSKSPTKMSPKSVAKIFKCDCGLHYTSMKTILKHLDSCTPGSKKSGEQCSKCHLIFPTEVLVTHLCNHHSKAKKIVIEKFSKVPLFKCSCCTLLFTNTEKYQNHVDRNCDPKNGRTCEHCHLNFDKVCFPTHKCSAKDNVTYITKINVMKKSSKFYTVYRCDLCDLSYLTYNSYKYHVFDVNHKISIQLVTCEFCGLKFTQYSWQKHVKIHTRNSGMYRIKVIDPVSRTSFMKIGNNIKCEALTADSDDLKPTRSSPRKRTRDNTKTEPENAKKLKKNDTDNNNQVKIEFVPTDPIAEDFVDNDNEIEMPDPISDHTLSVSITDLSLDTSDIKNEVVTDTKDIISNKLKARIMVHKYDKRLYRCKHCNQHFMKDSSFDYHVKAHNHKDNPENYKCDICDLDFSRYTLPRHKYVHHLKMRLNKDDFLILTESTYSKDGVDKEVSKNITVSKITDEVKVESENVNKISNDNSNSNIKEQSSEVVKIFEDSQKVIRSLSKIIKSYTDGADDDGKVAGKCSENVVETCNTNCVDTDIPKNVKDGDDNQTVTNDSNKVSKVNEDLEMNDNNLNDTEDSNDCINTASKITDKRSKIRENHTKVTDNAKTIEDFSQIRKEICEIATSERIVDSNDNAIEVNDDSGNDRVTILSKMNGTDTITDESNKITKFISELGRKSSDSVAKLTNGTKINHFSETFESNSDIIEDSSEFPKSTSEIGLATGNKAKMYVDRVSSHSKSDTDGVVTEDSNENTKTTSKTGHVTDNNDKIDNDDTRITSQSESDSELTQDSNDVKATSELCLNSDNAVQINEDIALILSDSYESSSVTDDSNEIKDIINKIAELGGKTEVISDLSNESSEATDISDDTANEISLSVSDIDTSNEHLNRDESICYFKCTDCNVCFLTQKMCYDHTVKHNILDPKTYIQCKICNFQFPIDSLKEHMEIHHCNDFRIENLTIQEFKAVGDGVQPKIDTYRAVDKVQSRLISTTTDVGVV